MINKKIIVGFLVIAFVVGSTMTGTMVDAAKPLDPTSEILAIVTDIQTKVNTLLTTMATVQTSSDEIKAKTNALPSDPARSAEILNAQNAINAHTDTALSQTEADLQSQINSIQTAMSQLRLDVSSLHALDLVVTNTDDGTFSLLRGNGDGTFSTATNYQAGIYPRLVAASDFNNDARMDIVIQGAFGNGVHLGNGDGSFDRLSQLALGITSIDIGDFNNDAKSDIVSSSKDVAITYLLLGNGDGTFSRVDPNVNVYGYITVGNLDTDLNQDLVIVNDNHLYTAFGNGDGTFRDLTHYNILGRAESSAAITDLDNDGMNDIVVTSTFGNNVVVILNQGNGIFGNGDGTLSAEFTYPVGSDPHSVAVRDFNNDGHPDLAIVNTASNNVSVLLNDGGGSFGAATNFDVGTHPSSVIVRDFNNDGHPDLAIVNTASNNVSVLLNDGGGSFGAATNFATGVGPTGIVVGQFD